jgi:thiol-disulfide isomerase/thioredoxin
MKYRRLLRTSTNRHLAFPAALAIFLSACGGGGPEGPAGEPAAETSAPLTQGPPDGTEASMVTSLLREPQVVGDFRVRTLDGMTLSSAEWRGKVVMVNFWATWCLPCRAEIPELIALQDKYRDHLVIVGISEDDLPPEIVRKFALEQKMNYPIAMTTPEIEKVFPGIVSLPTTFILDHEGRVAKKQIGQLNGLQAEAVTRALAGMSVNAKIERVDDPGRLTAESAAQVKDIPGIDLATYPPERRTEILLALNDEKCTCGCDMSVAKCRIEDPACQFSLPLARTIASKFASAK